MPAKLGTSRSMCADLEMLVLFNGNLGIAFSSMDAYGDQYLLVLILTCQERSRPEPELLGRNSLRG